MNKPFQPSDRPASPCTGSRHCTARRHADRLHRGFTLVEVLTVIVIIGILAAIAVPAIGLAVRKTKQGAQAIELSTLDRQIEQYALKYGDYPPDGSNLAVFTSHMRKLFPRMGPVDQTILARLTDDSSDPTTDGTFSGVAMDRAEALVFFLGGFSSDKQRPITGPGGPLDYRGPDPGTDAERSDLSNYQYNATRENALFEFEPGRLTMRRINVSDPDNSGETDPLLSSDELDLGYSGSPLTNRGGIDLLPAYLAVAGQPAPIVYFDSRTYGTVDSAGTVYNGYTAPGVGGIRPYKTQLAMEPPPYADATAAFNAVQFHNRDKFQIITPGLDGLFGSITSTTSADGNLPVHFVTETGRPVWPNASATSLDGLIYEQSKLGSKGFQDQDWAQTQDWGPGKALNENGHLDNITNFTTSILESGLQ